MKTPRPLNEIENIELDLTDYSYNMAFIIDGKVKYLTGTGELFARILLDSEQIVLIEDGQFSVDDIYSSE